MSCQAAIARRDAELQRLGSAVAAGRNADVLSLQHRADSAESVVLQLNQKAGPCQAARHCMHCMCTRSSS